MVFLVADVGCFVAGVTYRHRSQTKSISRDEQLQMEEQNRIHGGSPSDARRSAIP